MYKLKLQVGEEAYKSKGKTIEDALANLEPENIKFRGRFKVSDGDQTVELNRLITPIQYQRIKMRDTDRKVIAKHLKNLFGV